MSYLLVYASMSDFVEDEREKSLIKDLIGEEDYSQIHEMIDAQTDFERANTIQDHAAEYCTTEEAKNALIERIQSVYMADNEFSGVEQSTLSAIKRLL